MAFDYGSINLGIKNPFKTEGAVQSLRGTVVAALGIYLLFIAAQKVQTDQLVGWIIVLFGLGLLGNGIKVLSQGIIAMIDRKSTRLNSSHVRISYAVFCLKKKTTTAT